MGLIKAAMGAAGGVLADQWKEFFYCDSMSPDILMMKGQKQTSSRGRSSNTSGEDNIISNGSKIAVNNGQCMMIVESGKVVDVCNEPGEYIYDMSTEPSIFTGGLEQGLRDMWGQMKERFFGINSIKANEEDEAKIQKVQMGKTLSDPSLAMGAMADATSDSLRMAAQNEGGGGAAFGFMNMNMAGNAGAGMYQQMAQQQELMERRQRLMDHQQLEAEMARVKAEAERGVAAQAGSWTCPQCGTANLGKFCLNCGTKKPEPKPADTWDCDCGQTGNTGKFCMNCGKAKPEGKAPEAGWTCPKCGAVNQGKFCMECGTQKPADAPRREPLGSGGVYPVAARLR